MTMKLIRTSALVPHLQKDNPTHTGLMPEPKPSVLRGSFARHTFQQECTMRMKPVPHGLMSRRAGMDSEEYRQGAGDEDKVSCLIVSFRGIDTSYGKSRCLYRTQLLTAIMNAELPLLACPGTHCEYLISGSILTIRRVFRDSHLHRVCADKERGDEVLNPANTCTPLDRIGQVHRSHGQGMNSESESFQLFLTLRKI